MLNIDSIMGASGGELMLEQELEASPKFKKSNTATQSFLNGKNNRVDKMGEGISSQIEKGTLQEPVSDDLRLR